MNPYCSNYIYFVCAYQYQTCSHHTTCAVHILSRISQNMMTESYETTRRNIPYENPAKIHRTVSYLLYISLDSCLYANIQYLDPKRHHVRSY